MSNPAIHCCLDMLNAVQDASIPLSYNPKFREYGISVLDGGSSYLLIQYCPWCGSKLPSSLREVWFARLDKLGMEPDDASVPQEMLSETWWRKEEL